MHKKLGESVFIRGVIYFLLLLSPLVIKYFTANRFNYNIRKYSIVAHDFDSNRRDLMIVYDGKGRHFKYYCSEKGSLYDLVLYNGLRASNKSFVHKNRKLKDLLKMIYYQKFYEHKKQRGENLSDLERRLRPIEYFRKNLLPNKTNSPLISEVPQKDF